MRKKMVFKAFKNYNSREKSMLIVVLALIVILVVKSLFFDEVKDLSGDRYDVYQFTEYSVAQQHDGFLQKSHIIIYRVFDIYMADDKVVSVLRYEDPTTGEEIEKQIQGRYNARVRSYFLWIIPIGQFSVTAKTL